MGNNKKLIIVKNTVLPLCKKVQYMMLHIAMWVIFFFKYCKEI